MPVSVLATLVVAFLLGLQHATDSDHIVAVTALASDSPSPRHSALTGALWGLGHLLTLFLVGSALILLRMRMAPRVQWLLELGVALVLVWLGVHTIRKCFRGHYHAHAHRHGDRVHAHLHFHAGSEPDHEHAAHAERFASRRFGSRPISVLVGMAHGLAGTGGLALLVLMRIPSRLFGVVYLFIFGCGALAGMAAFSALLSVPLAGATRRLGWLVRVQFAVGAASGLLGAALAYQALLSRAFPF